MTYDDWKGTPPADESGEDPEDRQNHDGPTICPECGRENCRTVHRDLDDNMDTLAEIGEQEF